MNIARIFCSQLLSFSNIDTAIGFELSEDTEIRLDHIKLKLWASSNLYLWYRMQVLQGKRVFNLKKPIMLEVFWNEKLESILTQKRVTNDTIIRKDEDVPMPLTNCTYILTPYRENLNTDKSMIPQIDPINPEKIFNTIEYVNSGYIKYGSPIIYTGMTN
jgi:hypothetical protein